jgi:hypothetical protein
MSSDSQRRCAELIYSPVMGKKVRVVIDVTELGRAGGLATAKARTPAERQAAAKTAVQARWDAYYKLHPEKLKAKRSRAAKRSRKKVASK